MKCPLCSATKVYKRRRFSVARLSEEWTRGFGFNPFSSMGEVPKELTQWSCGRCDLRFYEPMLCGPAEFYEEMSRRFEAWYYEENKWEFDVAIDILSAADPRSLLELGCGKGYFLEKVAHALDAKGLEFNPEGVRACRGKGLKVSDDSIDGIQERFDAIASFEVLEHLAEPAKVLASMVERLNPGGLLIIAVPNPASYLSEADHTLLDMPPHHVTAWSAKTFSYLAQMFGLTLQAMHQEPLRYVHYRSYLSNYLSAYEPPTGSSIKARLRRFLSQIFWRASVPIVDAVAATSYQANKKLLIGQTHLAVLEKST
jgi:SAM-dependent methyltransferase